MFELDGIGCGGVFGSSRARYGPLGTFLSRRRSTNRSVVVEKERSECWMFRLERERVWLNMGSVPFRKHHHRRLRAFCGFQTFGIKRRCRMREREMEVVVESEEEEGRSRELDRDRGRGRDRRGR